MLASTSACKENNSSRFFKCNFICQYLRCHRGDVSAAATDCSEEIASPRKNIVESLRK